ncbi:single-stranded DNA-binding protein [Polynucleobacter sp. 86C-FISCH]|uniref:single-stranded DNA-binding protein n=1 Tax=Polynucleobacter sp. 86C-FISCH TaxID=2689101 RepID=UPI001C0B691E|nr:single-stranded DNA-binding protein [Polynucleobacter sp. 86C-FISCH]MBU3595100.1 single-stranded DNA-binding protein [Polynucleobacter sp. 86C-FISCH]
MTINAEVKGNLLADPEQKVIQVKGENKTITQIRIWSDVYKKDAADGFSQDEEKSMPVNITIWNERLGGEVMHLLGKGMRVNAQGELTIQTWVDKESGEHKHQAHIDANYVNLALNRIEQIQMKPKQEL